MGHDCIVPDPRGMMETRPAMPLGRIDPQAAVLGSGSPPTAQRRHLFRRENNLSVEHGIPLSRAAAWGSAIRRFTFDRIKWA